jgi:hypothetical protein
MKNLTIVSACDRKFLWGAFILAASVARHLPKIPLHLLQTGFTAHEANLLSQFGNVHLLPLADNNPRSVANRKSEALLSASTEYAAWLDADCMIIGDVAALLVPPNGQFQIRLREPWENAWVWRNHYARGEPRGETPAAVLQRWRADVGQCRSPRLLTTCVTNAFVLHQRHFDFVRQWKSQIAKVIPPADAGVVDTRNPAYFMTDESVLSSLLAFSTLAPAIGETVLNKDPRAHVAHFGANPKPWVRWSHRTWYCNRHVLDLLDWAASVGVVLPPVPWSLRRHNRAPAWLIACAENSFGKAKALAAKTLRPLLRRPARSLLAST